MDRQEAISELTSTEVDLVSGGAKNMDDPFVQEVFSAFKKTLADAQAGVVELARSSGCLGSTTHF
jgi:hypothetical protein